MAEEPTDLISACRKALRLSTCTDFDDEIVDLVQAARLKMVAGGVAEKKVNDDSDALVRVAIIAFVKACFGLDNPDSEKYSNAFESFVTQMKGTSAYGVGK